MQIVIDIPEEEYKCIQITGCMGNKTCISNAIYNGILLPKGHGRLIDADDVNRHIVGFVNLRDCPTIIEADKEGEE